MAYTRRSKHQWESDKSGKKVRCARCGIVVTRDEARRGVGPCISTTEEPRLEEQSSATPEINLGTCNACGQPLVQMPLNRYLDMIACANRRCDLYRERLRVVPALPVAMRLMHSSR